METARPSLRALVGVYEEPLGLIGDGLMVSLEDALDYQALGFVVLVDPEDETLLTRWEQRQRAMVGRQWARMS